jgi:hypothetical protein
MQGLERDQRSTLWRGTDWTFALSIAATLGLAVGAISILLFAM